MKRRLLMMLLPVAVCGCEPVQEQVKQNEATANMKSAQAHLNDANAGYNRSGKLDVGSVNFKKIDDTIVDKVKGLDPNQDYGAYRKAQLDKAANALKTLANAPTAAQQMGALSILGEIHSSYAIEWATEASVKWATDTMLVDQLTNLASSLREAKTAYETYRSISNEDIVADLNEENTALEKMIDDINKSISALQSKKEGLEGELADHAKKKAEHDTAFGEASRKAFTAKGQEAFDLGKSAAESQMHSELHANRIAYLKEQVDLVDSELTIEMTKLKQQQTNVELTKTAIAEINKRAEGIADLTNKSAALLKERQDNFSKLFTSVAANQSNVVEKAYTNVISEYDTAIGYLTRALNAANSLRDDPIIPGAATEGRARANFQLADAQSQKGHYQYQQHLVMTGYANFVANLANATSEGTIDPTLSSQFGDLVAKANQVAGGSKTAAIASITAAAESYQKAAESAANSESNQFKVRVQKEALTRMAQALDMLTNITGDANFKTRADAARTKISSIKEPGE